MDHQFSIGEIVACQEKRWGTCLARATGLSFNGLGEQNFVHCIVIDEQRGIFQKDMRFCLHVSCFSPHTAPLLDKQEEA